MKFENSKYSDLLEYKKISLPYGNFYITKMFIISELKEGIHVDHAMVSEIISKFSDEITIGLKVGYIANRINSYSFDPQLWLDFNNDHDFLIATAIISYNELNYMNATIEKQFFKKSLKRCHSLEEAIEWMQGLEEFELITN
ncbi:hypothetical protein [uncultured Psychroserpens sp.]|uniref:hypothetical protein n=1 Tax=uncultured Psychroserpens sp. TaxID=255436 RepID=UPI0026187B0C|nr:hypothetical protein [uncultured Psychroserpens sp.]